MSGYFNPVSTANDSILLRDSFVNDPFMGGDFSVTMTGLELGMYDVYFYSFAAASGLLINGVTMADLTGGDPEALAASPGSNWQVARVEVTDGTLAITDATPLPGEYYSGFQIVPF